MMPQSDIDFKKGKRYVVVIGNRIEGKFIDYDLNEDTGDQLAVFELDTYVQERETGVMRKVTRKVSVDRIVMVSKEF
jgi:hypothetical protein